MKKLLILAMFGLAFNSHSQLNVNLQGCYPMDCDSAQNFAPPGSLLDGTIFNVTCATGHTGAPNTAYQFAGNNTSYITLPASTLLKPNAITVTGWYFIDPATIINGAYVVFTKNSCSSNQEAYAMCVSGGKILIAKAGNTTPSCQRDILTGPNATAGWHFIAFYIDNSVMRLYVDGCSGGSAFSMPTTIMWDYVPTKNVILGGSQEAVDAPFKGRMDNLRFYNRLLSASEICSLFTNDQRCQYDGSRMATGLTEIANGKDIGGMGQNIPNPFSNNTVISYNTPSEFSKAQIVITSIEGKVIKSVDISTHGEGTVQIAGEELSKGFYLYTLIVDGTALETKKMIKE